MISLLGYHKWGSTLTYVFRGLEIENSSQDGEIWISGDRGVPANGVVAVLGAYHALQVSGDLGISLLRDNPGAVPGLEWQDEVGYYRYALPSSWDYYPGFGDAGRWDIHTSEGVVSDLSVIWRDSVPYLYGRELGAIVESLIELGLIDEWGEQ